MFLSVSFNYRNKVKKVNEIVIIAPKDIRYPKLQILK